MNDLLKYLGVILIIIGVVILGLYWNQHTASNALLIWAMSLFVGGMAAHIIFNRILD